jgi:hypothetical protein
LGAAHLDDQHPSRLSVVYKTFDLFDLCVDVFEERGPDDAYARACGITLLKARNLAHGSFSMTLDGLGQEAGALVRPMVECAELLTYLRLNPEDAPKALENRLPKAGDRARAINSIYKTFREHLNQNASHTSFSAHAIDHLVSSKAFNRSRDMTPHVLDKNLRDLVVQLHLLLHEAALATEHLGSDAFLPVAIRWERLKNRMFDVYGLAIGA